MLHRLAAAVALILTAATSPPTPAVLAPYVKNGQFDPGDYGWMRGAFADATPTQQATWKALWAWREGCRAGQFAEMKGELAKRGVSAVSIDQSNGSGLCGAIAYALPQDVGRDSWPAFQAALARARPVARAIVWSAALAQQAADPAAGDIGADIGAQLIVRPITDQMLRRAVSWDDGEVPGAPPLDIAARGIAAGMIWQAIAERDHANAAWLKAWVEAHGWPTIERVGPTASHVAWLLVQHADDDPVFQFDMLRLMEPLAARGAVAKKDYAALYDRVMLKLVGKQRYGSQMTCLGGRNVPRSLEDEANVDRLRRSMGMGTIAENVARMVIAYGPCPDDAVPVKVVPSPATNG